MNLYIIILLIALAVALIVCFISYLKWKLTAYAVHLYCIKNGINLPQEKIGKCGAEIITKYIFHRKERRKNESNY